MPSPDGRRRRRLDGRGPGGGTRRRVGVEVVRREVHGSRILEEEGGRGEVVLVSVLGLEWRIQTRLRIPDRVRLGGEVGDVAEEEVPEGVSRRGTERRNNVCVVICVNGVPVHTYLLIKRRLEAGH